MNHDKLGMADVSRAETGSLNIPTIYKIVTLCEGEEEERRTEGQSREREGERGEGGMRVKCEEWEN